MMYASQKGTKTPLFKESIRSNDVKITQLFLKDLCAQYRYWNLYSLHISKYLCVSHADRISFSGKKRKKCSFR